MYSWDVLGCALAKLSSSDKSFVVMWVKQNHVFFDWQLNTLVEPLATVLSTVQGHNPATIPGSQGVSLQH